MQKLQGSLCIRPRKVFFHHNPDALDTLHPKIKLTFEDETLLIDIPQGQFKKYKWNNYLECDIYERHFKNDIEIHVEIHDQQENRLVFIGSGPLALSLSQNETFQQETVTLIDDKNMITGTVDIDFEIKFKEDNPIKKKQNLETSIKEEIKQIEKSMAKVEEENPKKKENLGLKELFGKRLDPKNNQELDKKEGAMKKEDTKKNEENNKNKDLIINDYAEIDDLIKDYNTKMMSKESKDPQKNLKSNDKNSVDPKSSVKNQNTPSSNELFDMLTFSKSEGQKPKMEKIFMGTLILRPLSTYILNPIITSKLLASDLRIIAIHDELALESFAVLNNQNSMQFKEILSFPHVAKQNVIIKCISDHPELQELGECLINLEPIRNTYSGPTIVQAIIEDKIAVQLDLKFEIEMIPDVFEAPVKVYHPIEIKRLDELRKKIKYSNPDGYDKTIRIYSHNKNIVESKVDLVKLPAGGEVQLKFKFISPRAGEVRCQVDIILEEENRVEECLLFKIKAI